MATLVTVSQEPILQFLDNNGAPLVGGQLTTLVGGINFPTYSEPTGTFALPNPIILNSRGEVATNAGTSSPLYVAPNVSYTFILQDSNGVTIWTAPNIVSAATTATVLAQITATYLNSILNGQTIAETAASITPTNLGYAPGNVLRYGTNGTGVDMTLAFQAAFNQQSFGGAPVYVPTGAYLITAPITTTSPSPFTMYGDGMGKSVITKTGDSDCFVVNNSGSSFNQITISELTISAGSAMVNGSAFNLTCLGIIPSVTMHNVMVFCSGTNTFSNGIRLKSCGETNLDRVFIYGLGQASMIAVNVIESQAATVFKAVACSVYNCSIAFNFVNSTSPGVEGVQFYGCDIVNVQSGVIFNNTVGPTYFPPQFTWIGGHINCSNRAIDLNTMVQVTINGLLSYNTGSQQHINLNIVGDVNIKGNTFVQAGGIADGILMQSSNGPLNGGIIANNLFRMGATGSAVNLIATNYVNLTISDNQRVSGSASVTTTGLVDNTVLILNNTPKDPIDIFDTSITFASTMTLVGIRSDYCQMSAPGSATLCARLTSRRAWDRVIIQCSSANATIQHNGAVPDGFILANGLNYTFPATGGRITLEKRNGGYWTEVARN